MKRSINIVTDSGTTPVTTAEAKEHLRIETGVTADDTLVANQVKAATRLAEDYLGRALITQTRRLTLDQFPRQLIELPYPPVSAVGTVEYIDGTGGTSTVASTGYLLDSDASPARLMPAYGSTWPTTRDQMAAVKVTYTCGYGTSGTSVPEPIRQAILIQVAASYENRGEEGGDQLTEGAKRLLYPYRVRLV